MGAPIVVCALGAFFAVPSAGPLSAFASAVSDTQTPSLSVDPRKHRRSHADRKVARKHNAQMKREMNVMAGLSASESELFVTLFVGRSLPELRASVTCVSASAQS
jgi:hypothetical protein